MKTFEYRGAQPHIATHRVKGTDGKYSTIDVSLHPGETAILDETHDVVKGLIANGLLKEAGENKNQKSKSS